MTPPLTLINDLSRLILLQSQICYKENHSQEFGSPAASMAKENGAPTAAEKGKGKMEDDKPSKSSKKQDDTKKDKDGKPLANGKPGEEPLEGRLS